MLNRILPAVNEACQPPDNLHERYPNFNLVPQKALRHTQVGLILCYLTAMRRGHYDGRERIDAEIADVTALREAYGIRG